MNSIPLVSFVQRSSSVETDTSYVQSGAEETHVQGGAEETHVFHIRITLFIFNVKKF